MQKVVIRQDGSVDVQEIFPESGENENMCDQQYVKECDINNLMRKYVMNALPDPQKGVYADMSEVQDYRSALHIIKKAEDGFLALPSDVRSRFLNDPGKMIEFLQDPKNDEEAIKMQLKVPKSKSDTQKIIDKLDELKPAPAGK